MEPLPVCTDGEAANPGPPCVHGNPPTLCAICNNDVPFPDGTMPDPFSREGILGSAPKDSDVDNLPYLISDSSDQEFVSGSQANLTDSDSSDDETDARWHGAYSVWYRSNIGDYAKSGPSPFGENDDWPDLASEPDPYVGDDDVPLDGPDDWLGGQGPVPEPAEAGQFQNGLTASQMLDARAPPLHDAELSFQAKPFVKRYMVPKPKPLANVIGQNAWALAEQASGLTVNPVRAPQRKTKKTDAPPEGDFTAASVPLAPLRAMSSPRVKKGLATTRLPLRWRRC